MFVFRADHATPKTAIERQTQEATSDGDFMSFNKLLQTSSNYRGLDK